MKENLGKVATTTLAPHQDDAKSHNAILDGYHPPEDVAQELGVSRRTLARWRTQRTGPPWTKFGNVVVYRHEAVKEWLLKQEVAAVADRSARNSQHRQ